MTTAKDPKSPGAKIAGGGTTTRKKKPVVDPELQAYLDKYGGTKKGVYIGVESGSDLEKNGLQGPGYGQPGAVAGAKYGQQFRGYYGSRKPKYKVGYQNSQSFARELNNMDPNVIYLYQQRLNASGLLDSFTPGKLDKSTRGAFKELLTQANQTANTWQSTLQDIEAVGGVAGKDSKQQPDAFVAQLDDPVTLREAFQQTAQSLYGGDLPDDEINAMVDAYRSIQQAKQQAAYNANLASANGGASGTVEAEVAPGDYAAQQIKAKHPDQVAKVEFSGTLSDLFKAGAQTGGGLM